ncbi:assimilatory sulfite reductase [Flagelloscypha sp. PMI_526]|nr:assimilatory sulfite reductase [Flagelloscypha sp. PMI_526]
MQIFQNPLFSASDIVEYLSTRPENTSTVHVFDVAEQAGFGILTSQWCAAGEETAQVIQNQTRSGAGLGLVGRLSAGTSQSTGASLTAYTTPNGLSTMAPALALLPHPSPSSRLVIQVPNISAVGESFALSPSTAALTTVVPFLPASMTILLSSTAQETVDFTSIAYALQGSHVVHLFDHYSSAREIGSRVIPPNFASASSLSRILHTAGYSYFEYTGDSEATSIFVLLNGPLALVAQAIARRTPGLAVVTVKVLRPWNEEALRSIIPASAKHVHVIDEVPNSVSRGVLFGDVFGTLFHHKPSASAHSVRVTSSQVLGYIMSPETFSTVLVKTLPVPAAIPGSLIPPASKRILLLAEPKSPVASVPGVIQTFFLSSPGSVHSRLLTSHDVFSKAGGIAVSQLLLSSSQDARIPLPAAFLLDPSGSADLLVVLDQTLLKSHSVLTYAAPNAPVLVNTAWSADELASNLPQEAISIIIERNLRLFALNAKAVAETLGNIGGQAAHVLQAILIHLAFVRLYLGSKATEDSVLRVSQSVFAASLDSALLAKVNSKAWDALDFVGTYPPPPPESSPSSLRTISFNAIAVETANGTTVVNGARLSSRSYPQDPSLRPEVPDRTFLVTCSVNRRLTPIEYDRNVFHLEFDTAGTGLKYEIGEALGVHGWNDEGEVLEFCEWYGVDPGRLITIPVPGVEGQLHTRTVFQALQQQIDLFGRPPKSFYTELAAYATTKLDRHALLFIGSAEGSATLKKLAEKDTVTFADVLKMYPSARPTVEVLCLLIGDTKPRHYSIASAQSVVGDRVDLLVVTVDWVTPSGSPRYGQCTRYLAGLKVGQKVTVSIKPSVMKLPPSDMQPLILAGLGTGAAPFRAFLQHRGLLASQASLSSQEYLYGEDIEAFILDGVITKAGLAFSRDGRKKMPAELVRMLQDDEGVFYLCGPTWPVPDVFEALVGALISKKGLTRLKEEERYVLEVY